MELGVAVHLELVEFALRRLVRGGPNKLGYLVTIFEILGNSPQPGDSQPELFGRTADTLEALLQVGPAQNELADHIQQVVDPAELDPNASAEAWLVEDRGLLGTGRLSWNDRRVHRLVTRQSEGQQGCFRQLGRVAGQV